jgi:hypothetical protein
MKEKLRNDLKYLKNIWVRVLISIIGGWIIAGYFRGSLGRDEARLIFPIITFVFLYFVNIWLFSDNK